MKKRMKNRMTKEEDYRYRIDKALAYIRENLDSDIDIRKLAGISAFSPFHFHRIMSAYLGEPIGAFIIRQRVEKAARLLRYSGMNVSDIAYTVGYNMPSSLTKAFVRHLKVSPTEFRLTKSYHAMTMLKEKPEVKLSRGKVVELEPKTVLYISASGNYSGIDYSAMFQRMWQEVKTQNLFSAGIEHLALYYDNPEITEDRNLKCDVCLHVCKPAVPNNDIGVKEIEGGRFAVFTYIGEYSKVGVAYDRIYGELLAKKGLETRGNYCFEKYISDPRRTEPSKLKTEIYIPVE